MLNSSDRIARWWAGGLIAVGVVLLLIVFWSAFAMIGAPGDYFDEWVPAEGATGPEASFEWMSSGMDVEFVDTSTAGDATIEGWAWDFGDGAGSEDPNPIHRYDGEGEWTVTLEVIDATGLTSRAEAAVGIEPGSENSGEGAIGLNDLANNVIDAVDRAAKGVGVVVLVIGLFLVLTMIGGRLVRQGVRALRPVPDRISVKLRPRTLELAMRDHPEAVVDELPEVAAEDMEHEVATVPVGS